MPPTNPKDTLGDKPRYRIDAPSTGPTKAQKTLLVQHLTRELQKAVAALDQTQRLAASAGKTVLSRFAYEQKCAIANQIVKLSGGEVMSLEEMIHS